jgi:hypothetical protein
MIVYEENPSDQSIIEQWMGSKDQKKQSSSVLQRSTNEISIKLPDLNQKGGLGYVETKNSSASRLQNDNLGKILSQQQKKSQNKRNFNDINTSQRDLHGVIETDLFEESRTQIMRPLNKNIVDSNNKQNVKSKKPKNNNESSISYSIDKSATPASKSELSKANSSSGKKSTENVKSKELTPANAPSVDDFIVSTTSSSFENSSDQDKRNRSQQKKKGDSAAEHDDIDAGRGRQRKRKKTRSKQKNIRKDTRPDENKPEYLRFGSDQYDGRELSEETKKKLGMVVQG